MTATEIEFWRRLEREQAEPEPGAASADERAAVARAQAKCRAAAEARAREEAKAKVRAAAKARATVAADVKAMEEAAAKAREEARAEAEARASAVAQSRKRANERAAARARARAGELNRWAELLGYVRPEADAVCLHFSNRGALWQTSASHELEVLDTNDRVVHHRFQVDDTSHRTADEAYTAIFGRLDIET